MHRLKYPIGQFERPELITKNHIGGWIQDIKSFPNSVKAEIEGLAKDELQWAYRPNGWTIHQLIHHCADSHMNALIRFKLAITEDNPTIKPYMEGLWAELPDTLETPIDWSLDILKGLHQRWGFLLKRLTNEQLSRVYVHPEHGQQFSVDETIGMYAWHCNHHLAHIRQAIKHRGSYDIN